MKHCNLSLGVLAGAIILAHTPAWATNGYFLPGYGFRSQGMGGVGISYGVDSLSIVANPANIVNTGMRADMGVGLFNAERDVKIGGRAKQDFSVSNAGFGFNGETASNREWFVMPEMGMTMNLSENLHAGIAFAPNGGGSTVYPFNFFSYNALIPDVPGKDQKLGGELMQLLVPITLGYKLDENHAVGVALDLAVQRFRMYGLGSFKTFSSTFNVPISADFDHLTNNGFDYSYGAGMKLGYLGNFYDDKLAFGVSYTSRTYMTKFDKYRGLLAEQGDFDIPANYGVGITFKPRKNLVISADINKIDWASIAALGNRGPGTSPAGPTSPNSGNVYGAPYPGGGQEQALDGLPSTEQSSPGVSKYSTGNDEGMGFGWENQVVYKLGVNWGLNERLQLRAGFNYGKSPIPDDQLTFNTMLPVTTEKHYTFGFTYKATEELEITGTYVRVPEARQHSPNDMQNVVSAVDIGMAQQMFALSLGWVLDPGETNYGDAPMDPVSFAGWYFGFGSGQSIGRSWDAGRFASALASAGVTATQTVSESEDFAFKVFSGFQFNKYLALETGYSQFNNFTASGAITAPVTQVSARQNEKNNAWILAAVGTLPLTKDISIFGKLGANNWKRSTNTFIRNNFGDTVRTSTLERGYDPYYGVGVSYALMENLDLRGEYERYDLDGSKVDFISAGMAVRF